MYFSQSWECPKIRVINKGFLQFKNDEMEIKERCIEFTLPPERIAFLVAISLIIK